MKRLEDYINENRTQFETNTPTKDHEDRFLKLLQDQDRIRSADRFARYNRLFQVAAVIIILAGFGAGIMAILNNPTVSELKAERKLPAEIREIEQYYNAQTQAKLDRIETLSGSGPEATKVKVMLTREIESLNASSASLKSEYLKGTQDERLIDAIKNNYRVLSGLLDKVVDELARPADNSSEKINQKLNTPKYESTIS